MIYLKSDREIEGIYQAGQILAEIFDLLHSWIKPGVTTRELDSLIEERIKLRGAKPTFKGYCGFPAASCISINDVLIHGIPDETVIQEGDLVSVDIAATKGKHIADAARSYLVGQVSEEAQRIYQVTKEALDRAIAEVAVDNFIGDISAAIGDYLRENKYYSPDEYSGHGVGFKLHEDPSIPNRGIRGTGMRMRPGLVLAIEPMVIKGGREIVVESDGWTVRSFDRTLTCHFEDTVAITRSGVRVMTRKEGM